MINLNTLNPIQALDAEIFQLSLCGNFAVIAAIKENNPDAVAWHVAETDGVGGWVEIYYASESVEDALDVFSIVDEADYETYFDLFNAADSTAVIAA